MKKNEYYIEDEPITRGILIGLISSTLITLYDIYDEDINKKAVEIYNKIEPHIKSSFETISKVDPDLMQIGISSAVVAVLTGILINLRNKDKEKVNEKSIVKSGFPATNNQYAVNNQKAKILTYSVKNIK